MSQKLVPRGIILFLLAGVLMLPIAAAVVLAVSSLLTAMGDTIGGYVLRYIALGGGVLWVVDLTCLVLVQGLNSLIDDDRPPKQ